MTRMQFLRSVVGAGVGAIGVAALAGCGGDDGGGGGTPDSPAAVCTTPTSAIQGNHGHTLVVSLADVNAAVDKTYDITGTSAHAHMVTITAADFAMIKAGTTRMVVSTTGGSHTHPVSVMCVS